MNAIFNSPYSHKLAAIGIMVGAMILIDSAMPGIGLLFIAVIFAVMFLKSNAYTYILQLFNWASGKEMHG